MALLPAIRSTTAKTVAPDMNNQVIAEALFGSVPAEHKDIVVTPEEAQALTSLFEETVAGWDASSGSFSFAIGAVKDDPCLEKIKKTFLLATKRESFNPKKTEHIHAQQALSQLKVQADALRQDRLILWRQLGDAIGVGVFEELEALRDASGVDVAKAFLKWMKTHKDSLDGVEKFKADDLQLTSIPPEIGFLTNLRFLGLSQNKIKELPHSIGNLVKLEHLEVSSNQLTSLPDSIGELDNLDTLSLHYNDLKSLPDSLCNLLNLRYLYVSLNKLTKLPVGLGRLGNLEKLNLSDNKLESLPNSFSCLVKLDDLDLTSNHLTELPEDFGKLKSLQWLWVSRNRLKKLPDSFRNLETLYRLELYTNPLEKIPDSLEHLPKLRMLTLPRGLEIIPPFVRNIAEVRFL